MLDVMQILLLEELADFIKVSINCSEYIPHLSDLYLHVILHECWDIVSNFDECVMPAAQMIGISLLLIVMFLSN